MGSRSSQALPPTRLSPGGGSAATTTQPGPLGTIPAGGTSKNQSGPLRGSGPGSFPSGVVATGPGGNVGSSTPINPEVNPPPVGSGGGTGTPTTQPPPPFLQLQGPQRTGVKPAVPSSGAYLGAWVNPSPTGGNGNTAMAQTEMQQIPTFDQTVGRTMGMYSVYTSFSNPPPSSLLQALHSYGATPFVSWACTDVASVTAGFDDSTVTAYAKDLKQFGYPVLLRWYWEMNNQAANNSFNAGCNGYSNATLYVTAWRHIWQLFQQAGASNVAFVWNPSGGTDASSYYPGDQYVDWIAADGYDQSGNGTAAFAKVFGGFYSQWSPHNKPILIGETGAHAQDQAQFLQGVQGSLPTQFPDIKALVYWDATGSRGQWELQGSGLNAFKSLARSAYFLFDGS